MTPFSSSPRTYAVPSWETRYGILAQGLLDATPSIITNHVEHWRQPLVDADGCHVTTDGGSHLDDKLWVEGGSPRQRRGVDGRLVCGEPGQAFLMHDGGNSQSGGLDELPLQVPHPLHALLRRHGAGTEDSGEMTEAFSSRLRPGDVTAEDVLHGRHFAGHDIEAQPDAAELGDLLSQGHLGDQGIQPDVRICRGITPDSGRRRVRWRCGHWHRLPIDRRPMLIPTSRV